MSWFGKKVTITVMGADAQEAHALMHEFDIEHHAFHNFNGLNFKDDGEFGLVATGSNNVTIPLHGKAAQNTQEVTNRLQARNPKWKLKIGGR